MDAENTTTEFGRRAYETAVALQQAMLSGEYRIGGSVIFNKTDEEDAA